MLTNNIIPMEKKLPSVLIAIPNLGTIHTKLMMVLMRWMSDNQEAWDRIAIIAPTGLIPHDNARNFCVKEFLKTDMEYLFFIDSDVVPPFDALRKLLEADQPAITGCYPSVRFNKAKDGGKDMKIYNVFRHVIDDETGEMAFQNVYGEGVEQVESCGGGCLLIKRNVLEAIPNNWFRFQYWPDGLVKYGEDIDFCNQLHVKGIPLFAHFDVICVHNKEIAL